VTRWIAFAAVVFAALLLDAPVVPAAEPELDRVDLGAPEAVVEAQRARWQARLAAARSAVIDAHLRSIEATDAYRFMRHRNRDRGEEKRAILAEMRAAETALAEAVDAMHALLDSARSAGVPPGWYPDRDLPASSGGGTAASPPGG